MRCLFKSLCDKWEVCLKYFSCTPKYNLKEEYLCNCLNCKLNYLLFFLDHQFHLKKRMKTNCGYSAFGYLKDMKGMNECFHSKMNENSPPLQGKQWTVFVVNENLKLSNYNQNSENLHMQAQWAWSFPILKNLSDEISSGFYMIIWYYITKCQYLGRYSVNQYISNNLCIVTKSCMKKIYSKCNTEQWILI